MKAAVYVAVGFGLGVTLVAGAMLLERVTTLRRMNRWLR